MDGERSRGLGLRFGLTTVLLLVVVVGLVLWGGRLLPAAPVSEFTPLTVLTLLAAVVLVLALVRLPLLFLWPPRQGARSPFDRLPSLENELRGFIEDYESDIESYREEFTELGPEAEPFIQELDNAKSDLKTANERLKQRRYPSAFRRYYQAQRELVDLTPGFELVDRKHGRRRDRTTELVDQVRIAAEELDDASARAAVERHLAAFEVGQRAEDGSENEALPDLSQVKMAIRRIHAAQLQSLSSYLKLRRFLELMNVAMALGILVVLVAVLLVMVGEQVGMTSLVDDARALGGSFITEGRLLFVPMVFWFGALGAVLNILRRLGGPTLFENTPTIRELPDDLIMRPSLVSRVLWGSIAAFVVFLFTSLSGEFNVAFVILTAIVAGFSEQLLGDILAKHHDRLTRTADTDGDAEESETPRTGVTYDSRGRLVVHGASKELVEDVLARYEESLDGLPTRPRRPATHPGETDSGGGADGGDGDDREPDEPSERSRRPTRRRGDPGTDADAASREP